MEKAGDMIGCLSARMHSTEGIQHLQGFIEAYDDLADAMNKDNEDDLWDEVMTDIGSAKVQGMLWRVPMSWDFFFAHVMADTGQTDYEISISRRGELSWHDLWHH